MWIIIKILKRKIIVVKKCIILFWYMFWKCKLGNNVKKISCIFYEIRIYFWILEEMVFFVRYVLYGYLKNVECIFILMFN